MFYYFFLDYHRPYAVVAYLGLLTTLALLYGLGWLIAAMAQHARHALVDVPVHHPGHAWDDAFPQASCAIRSPQRHAPGVSTTTSATERAKAPGGAGSSARQSSAFFYGFFIQYFGQF